MTTEATETKASETAAEDVAAPSSEHDSPQASPEEGGGDSSEETTKPEGEKKPEPPAPDVKKLTAWSEKLSRRKGRLDERESKVVERERAVEERDAKAREILALLETDPDKLLDQVAKIKGTNRPAVYKSWMERTLQENDPNERVTRLERQLQERDEAAKAKAEADAKAKVEANRAAMVTNYLEATKPYVQTVLPKYEHLSAYTPESVWQRSTAIAIDHWRKTGQELPLDKVLQDMENATAADYKRIKEAEESRQRGSDAQEPTHSERAGAGKSAQPETRKRGLTNAHAATRASPESEDDVLNLSEKELDRRAIEALRRADPRWR